MLSAFYHWFVLRDVCDVLLFFTMITFNPYWFASFRLLVWNNWRDMCNSKDPLPFPLTHGRGLHCGKKTDSKTEKNLKMRREEQKSDFCAHRTKWKKRKNASLQREWMSPNWLSNCASGADFAKIFRKVVADGDLDDSSHIREMYEIQSWNRPFVDSYPLVSEVLKRSAVCDFDKP